MNLDEINRMTITTTHRFKLLLQRKHEIERARRALRTEEREIDIGLLRMSGIQKGDTIELYAGEKLLVNTVSPSFFITDDFCRHDDATEDRVYLSVQGEGSPITKAGAPSKAEKHRGWNKVIRTIWITLAEYRKLCPVEG